MRKLSILFLFAALSGAQTFNTIIITPKSDDTSTGEIRLREKRIHGVNHVGFKAPDPIAADAIWTLPAADGSSGQSLATNGAGVLSFVTGAGAADNSVVSSRASGGYTAALELEFMSPVPGLSVTLNRLGKWLITVTLNVNLPNDISAHLWVNSAIQVGAFFWQQHIYDTPPSELRWTGDITLSKRWIYNNTAGTGVVAQIKAGSGSTPTAYIGSESEIIAVWIGP